MPSRLPMSAPNRACRPDGGSIRWRLLEPHRSRAGGADRPSHQRRAQQSPTALAETGGGRTPRIAQARVVELLQRKRHAAALLIDAHQSVGGNVGTFAPFRTGRPCVPGLTGASTREEEPLPDPVCSSRRPSARPSAGSRRCTYAWWPACSAARRQACNRRVVLLILDHGIRQLGSTHCIEPRRRRGSSGRGRRAHCQSFSSCPPSSRS
jgi:hypothetical protein